MIRQKVLDETLPKDPRTRVRVVIGMALWLTMLLVGAIITSLTTGLPLVGQVAWSNEVDRKIDKAVEPIKSEVAKLESAMKQQTRVSNQLLASVTASQIRATYARICARPKDSELERLHGDLDRFLAEYPLYTEGRSFPLESLRCNSP